MSTQHYGPGGGTTTAVHGCCVHLARIEESRPMCTVPSTSCLARCTLLSRPSAQHITHASQAPHSELSAHSTKRKCQRKSYVRSVSVAPTRRRTLHARARAPSLSRGHCPPHPTPPGIHKLRLRLLRASASPSLQTHSRMVRHAQTALRAPASASPPHSRRRRRCRRERSAQTVAHGSLRRLRCALRQHDLHAGNLREHVLEVRLRLGVARLEVPRLSAKREHKGRGSHTHTQSRGAACGVAGVSSSRLAFE